MKLLGLLGGLSWESTAVYYRRLNQLCQERLGPLHSLPLLLWSFDFEPVARYQQQGDWAAIHQVMTDAATRLSQAGAEGLLICSNTIHKVADEFEASLALPVLHIADAVANELARRGLVRPALLGTTFTMQSGFYRSRLERGGVEVQLPAVADREQLHRIIYDELCQGRIEETSRQALREIVTRVLAAGADSVILGCTELPLLIPEAAAPWPVLDTTELHVRAALNFALG